MFISIYRAFFNPATPFLNQNLLKCKRLFSNFDPSIHFHVRLQKARIVASLPPPGRTGHSKWNRSIYLNLKIIKHFSICNRNSLNLKKLTSFRITSRTSGWNHWLGPLWLYHHLFLYQIQFSVTTKLYHVTRKTALYQNSVNRGRWVYKHLKL